MPALILKMRVVLFPLTLKPGVVFPLILKFFEITNGELKKMGLLTNKETESPALAAAIRSRKVPGPLSAELVTTSVAANDCDDANARLHAKRTRNCRVFIHHFGLGVCRE